jgi:hypothetical protein
MIDDGVLLARLRDMWATADPMPSDLAERVLFTLQLEDLEVELMRLHEADPLEVASAGVRGAAPDTEPEAPGIVTFSSASLTVMLTVTGRGAEPRRVEGWIAPAAALGVELRRADGVQHTVADPDGRFAFEGVPAGLIQLRIRSVAGEPPGAVPVVTPAVQI